MALTKNTTTVTNISDLSSTPNATEGLTAAQLQAKFDKTGADLKTYINDTLTAEIDTSISNLSSGWIPSGETWTYVSVDDPTGVFKVNTDVTTKYSLGMRIKMTNGGNIIYGILTKIGTYGADEAGYTYLTFLHEINTSTGNSALHLMANSAITANYYSVMKVPFGFPLEQNKWTIYATDTSNRSQSSPTASAWYNLGGVYYDIPIGSFKYGYSASIASTRASAGSLNCYCTLSTANNTQSEAKLTRSIDGIALTQNGFTSVFAELSNYFTSKTRMYFNTKTDNGNGIYNGNGGQALILQAVCAYL